MTKILFLIHDLGGGGAEKVLISLVNHMDRTKFDITLVSLFGGGINEQYLAPHVKYRAVWLRSIPGNSRLMKLMTPEQLHRICIKRHYDVEVAFLEGPATRIIGGCRDPQTRLICWIHVEQHTKTNAVRSFRNYEESCRCYRQFSRIVCVSEKVKEDYLTIYPQFRDRAIVLNNTIETNKILAMKDEPIQDVAFRNDEINLVAVGKINKNKGIDRLARIVKRLRDDGLPVHLYALGTGDSRAGIENYLHENGLSSFFTFTGYKKNPYQYVAQCDLYVCASLAEGFSTATAEALIVGTPVCTVEVAGMREMLGENNEWGIVTENTEDALYAGIKRLLEQPDLLAHYKVKAVERGRAFSTDNAVKATEELIEEQVRTENRD